MKKVRIKYILSPIFFTIIGIALIEIFIFRSIAFKDFLIKWSYFKERHAWFPLFRTLYLKSQQKARKGSKDEICIIGTSTAASAFDANLLTLNRKKIYKLTTVLCGGENLLLQLYQSAFLPQKNIILFMSGFSFYQPFSEYPITDIIDLKSILFLWKIYLENKTFRHHKIFSTAKNNIIYYFLASMRFSTDFKYAVKHYLNALCFNHKTRYPDIIFRDSKIREKEQAQSLIFQGEKFKYYYFAKILNILKKTNKKVVIIRTRFHSELTPLIKASYSDKFDNVLKTYKLEYNFIMFDMVKDIKISDTDYKDFTHFNESGQKKILEFFIQNNIFE